VKTGSTVAVKNIWDGVWAFYTKKLKVRVAAPKVSVILGTSSADGPRVGKAYPADVVYRSAPVLGGRCGCPTYSR